MEQWLARLLRDTVFSSFGPITDRSRQSRRKHPTTTTTCTHLSFLSPLSNVFLSIGVECEAFKEDDGDDLRLCSALIVMCQSRQERKGRLLYQILAAVISSRQPVGHFLIRWSVALSLLSALVLSCGLLTIESFFRRVLIVDALFGYPLLALLLNGSTKLYKKWQLESYNNHIFQCLTPSCFDLKLAGS